MTSFVRTTFKKLGSFAHHTFKTLGSFVPHATHALHQFAAIAPQLGAIGNSISTGYGHPKVGANISKGFGIAGNAANFAGTSGHFLHNKGSMKMSNPYSHVHTL